jgi:hypothetical protein
MNGKTLIVGALALAGVLATGLAQARDREPVQWSVTIGTPVGVPVYRESYPVYTQPVPVVPRYQYRQPTRWDIDGDGIPNRFDRVYNPRWDVDGDGIPNRYDRVYNPRHDRDGDRIAHGQDRHDGLPGRGR